MLNEECRMKDGKVTRILLLQFCILHSSFCVRFGGRRLAADEPAGHAWESKRRKKADGRRMNPAAGSLFIPHPSSFDLRLYLHGLARIEPLDLDVGVPDQLSVGVGFDDLLLE